MNEIGKNIAEVRKKAKMSQERFAEKIGVSRQIVNKWENGEATPSTRNLNLICKAFNVDTEFLLGLKKDLNQKTKVEEKGKSINKKVVIIFIIFLIFIICLLYLIICLIKYNKLSRINNKELKLKNNSSYNVNLHFFKEGKIYKEENIQFKDGEYLITQKNFNNDNNKAFIYNERINLNKKEYIVSDSNGNIQDISNSLNEKIYENGQYLYNKLPDILRISNKEQIFLCFLPGEISIKSEKDDYLIITKTNTVKINKKDYLPIYYFLDDRNNSIPTTIYYDFK